MMFEEILTLMGSAWFVIVIYMTLLWLLGKFIQNYAIVDVGWGSAITLAALTYYTLGNASYWRAGWITLIVFYWGMRLSVFLLFTRVVGGHEDPRYTAFREGYGDAVDRKFFTNVFQLQGILAVLLSIPFIFPNLNPVYEMHWLETAAVCLFWVGAIGEAVADFQLNEFKTKRDNKGKVCNTGLWKYSRHPNYFFEWLIWLAFGLYSAASPWGWIGLLSPIVMFILLTKVTGIPLNEEYQLKSKRELYREYQKNTSAFFPLPKFRKSR